MRFFFSDIVNIEKYRLSATQLNYLTHALAKRYNKSISDDQAVGFHKIEKERSFVICPVSRDSVTTKKYQNIPLFQDTIKKFLDANENAEDILLIPLVLCRGYAYLPNQIFARNHAVLLAVDLNQKKLTIFDSQDNFRAGCYPKSYFNYFEGFNFENDSYKSLYLQKDDFSCGYYVFMFIKQILENGLHFNINDIKLNVLSYPTRDDFLQEYCGRFDGKKGSAIEDVMAEFEEDVELESDNEADVVPVTGAIATTVSSAIQIPPSSLLRNSFTNSFSERCSLSESPTNASLPTIKVGSSS